MSAMKRINRAILLWTVIFFAHQGSGLAQQTYAIVIGISKYRQISPLQFADKDALAFAAFLKAQKVPDSHIRIFLNDAATRIDIIDELYHIRSVARPDDRVFFYFGGHGDVEVQDKKDHGLLLLPNATRSGYYKGNDYLRLADLEQWLSAISRKKSKVYFIADACKSGNLIGGSSGQQRIQGILQESWGEVNKVLSSGSNESSLEGKQWGGGRGLFSFHLVKGLNGLADKNSDGKLSIGEINDYLALNVPRDALPNLQHPVVSGKSSDIIARVYPEILQMVKRAEQLEVPYIGEVNARSYSNEELETKLDTTIVSTYRQMTKAIREKRVSPVDDSLDNAWMHYRVLSTKKIPPDLSRLITRNMAAALMERELILMKPVRETGVGFVRADAEVTKARKNLELAQELFPSDHYISRTLSSRIKVLEYCEPLPYTNRKSIDENLANINAASKLKRTKLLQALELEPNMASTYTFLATAYRAGKMTDSSIYYQERVVELLPNELFSNYNAALNYSSVKLKDKEGKFMPHPQMDKYLQKVMAIDSNSLNPLSLYAGFYMGMPEDSPANNFKMAAVYYQKLLVKTPAPDSMYVAAAKSPVQARMPMYIPARVTYLFRIHIAHLMSGNKVEAKNSLDAFVAEADRANNLNVYRLAISQLYTILSWNEGIFNEYQKICIELCKKALVKTSSALTTATPENLAVLRLLHKDNLAAMGTILRAGGDFTGAEPYLLEAIGIEIPEGPLSEKLKLTGSAAYEIVPDRVITIPSSIMFAPDRVDYRICPYEEMFHLRMQQGDQKEAFEWLEKGMINSKKERGNDLSGKPFMESVFATYPAIDKERFTLLREKYAFVSDH